MRRLRLEVAAVTVMGLFLVGAAYLWTAQRGEESGLAHARTNAAADARAASVAPTSPTAPTAPTAGSLVAYRRPGPGLNLLALEASPYLQLHAHNPVDWYPWGEEAFARARAEDKIVFLSVGYSTCYWCHVMERKVFSDPEIAAFMNAHFVSIKVDREERPDIDDIYMKATHLLTGSGGWPNSLFLTADGKPFYAGTYFPPEDRYGRPGFPRLLRSLHESWTNQREKVLAVAERTTQRIEQMANSGASSSPPPPAADAMRQALDDLRRDFDAENGGFGRRTKFPRPPVLDLLLTRLERERTPEIEAMLIRTLDAMALGGIYDHLADGFHRYSTEPTWSIPHFEKMLYDNAQLVSVYARAYTLTGNPLYRRIVERTLAYMDREMSHPEGGFVSAQDAEVGGEEGASYVWSRAEIRRVLGKQEAEAFFGVYELTPTREKPEVGVLRVRLPVAELLKENGARDMDALLARFDDARAALLAQRNRRPQPLRDDKVLTAWNGLAIRGLVEAAKALERPEYLHRAERAAHFVLARLLAEDGTLRRSYIAGQSREAGVLDDYAFLADGLLALHQATLGEGKDERWLATARRLTDVLLAQFEDASAGGFFLTPKGSKLFVRPKPFDDNAVPSGNGVALRVLRNLAAGGESKQYSQAATRAASAAGALLRRAPYALPTIVAALTNTPEPRGAAIARAGAGVQADSAYTFRLPRSEDHVRVRLVRPEAGSPSEFVVSMTIEEGWHVNANPASLPFLIATAVEVVDGNGSAKVRYPAGRSFRPEFSSAAIQVYEGTLEIPVSLEDGADSSERLALRFQACDASRCLPPHRAILSLEASAEAAP